MPASSSTTSTLVPGSSLAAGPGWPIPAALMASTVGERNAASTVLRLAPPRRHPSRRVGCPVRLRLAFDAEGWQPAVEPAGKPPVGPARQVHQRGHEHRPDDEGVDDDRAGQPDAELLDDDVVPEQE